jgi:Glyoxalase-like domain
VDTLSGRVKIPYHASSHMVATPVDHLVYGVANLETGIDELERSLGVRAAGGGQHLGRGTHNALLALGGASYLEIIAPDPEQNRTQAALAFGLETLERSQLIGWAIRTAAIDALVAEARAAGYDPGPIDSMERLRPDGTVLQWRLTSTPFSPSRFVVPFVIDWGGSSHPSETAPAGVALVALRIEHPDPASIQPALGALHVAVPVAHGPKPALIAALDTPRGRIELR